MSFAHPGRSLALALAAGALAFQACTMVVRESGPPPELVLAPTEGMWLFEKPPAASLMKNFQFEPSQEWLEHVQRSCVRFPGGSGSIVSANGLVMTNHHVGRDMVEKLSTPERDLLHTGFYAKTLADELPCPALELLCLWNVSDVTADVLGGVKPSMSPAEAQAARQKKVGEIEKAAESKTGLDCQVVTLYAGGRYHLYEYKRYTEVKLVMAPEEDIAFFGGDADNFEYPRYDLDCAFFRIYEDGKPLKPEHFLRWNPDGCKEGDLIFVAGHPGSTNRLDTVADLEYQRDVSGPASLRTLWRREVQLAVFSGRSSEHKRIAAGDYFGVQNSRKARTGIYSGMLDPTFMERKRAEEAALRRAVDADPAQSDEWGGAWDEVERAKQVQRELYPISNALGGLGGSELFAIARTLVRLAAELPKPTGERLREYRDTALDALYDDLYSPAPIYPELEVDRIESALLRMSEALGGGHELVLRALSGKTPRARAEELVAGTALIDVAVRKQLGEGGKKAIDASRDPLIAFALSFEPEARALRKRIDEEVEGRERQAYQKIAEARFAVFGESVYPDATFTLRMAFGVVKGYRVGNQPVAPFTDIAGLYRRSEERGGADPFDLPKSWADRRGSLDLSTPFNFVHTADIIGGNSGSPTIDREGRVVGLIFDGNIHSLTSDLAYPGGDSRALSVDSRAMIEALRKVYDAGALADELLSQ